jgi:hypothetical protein
MAYLEKIVDLDAESGANECPFRSEVNGWPICGVTGIECIVPQPIPEGIPLGTAPAGCPLRGNDFVVVKARTT